jgi:rod shape-determining protein MreD
MNHTLQEISMVFISLLTAFGLTLLPLPPFTVSFIPDWTLMTVLYWAIYLPQRVGLGIAWITGLLMDVLTNSILGEHALASALALYLPVKLYRRIRTFSIWQQMIAIGILMAIYRAILFWIQGIIHHPLSEQFWFPALTDMLLWPLVVIILRDLQNSWGGAAE